MVTAGFRCASLLPHAMAVKTPAITANAHPAVITIQPLPSSFDRLSSTAATTPSPSKTRIIVPRNSPTSGEVIAPEPPSGFHPVKRSCDRFLPLPVQLLALRFGEMRRPSAVHRPVGAQLFQAGKEFHRQAGHISCAERRRFLNHRAHHLTVQETTALGAAYVAGLAMKFF